MAGPRARGGLFLVPQRLRAAQAPDDRLAGMIYVVALERPYSVPQNALILQPLLVVGTVATATVLLSVVLDSRLTAPLEQLASATSRMAEGGREARVSFPKRRYREVSALVASFREMQESIARRDQDRRRRRGELQAANEQLIEVDLNNMATPGFVTHELKAPLGPCSP